MAEKFMKLLSTRKEKEISKLYSRLFYVFLTLSFLLWKIKDQGFQNSFLSFFILYISIYLDIIYSFPLIFWEPVKKGKCTRLPSTHTLYKSEAH